MKKYVSPACRRISMDVSGVILANSVIDNSVVSSVGQEIGTEVEFTAESFVNTNWESGAAE